MDTTSRHQDIVEEMIARLRKLQGSGEYVPLARKIQAGSGLSGGGPLDQDVAVSVDARWLKVLERAEKAGDIASTSDLDSVREEITGGFPPHIFYRDFTIIESPSHDTAIPKIYADNDCTITSIRISATRPGSQPISAQINSATYKVKAGQEWAAYSTSITVKKNESIKVSIGQTDASGIVVSLRFEEH